MQVQYNHVQFRWQREDYDSCFSCYEKFELLLRRIHFHFIFISFHPNSLLASITSTSRNRNTISNSRSLCLGFRELNLMNLLAPSTWFYMSVVPDGQDNLFTHSLLVYKMCGAPAAEKVWRSVVISNTVWLRSATGYGNRQALWRR